MGYRKVSVLGAAKGLDRPWTQLMLGAIEDYDVKVAVYEGEYGRHMHEHHDEFIYVMNGRVSVEFDDDTVDAGPGDGVFIQRGTPHKSRAKGRAEVMLFEKKTIMDDYLKVD